MIDGADVTGSRRTLSGSESDKDLAEILSDFGKSLRKTFKRAPKSAAKTEMPDTWHAGFTFAAVYANDLAETVIKMNLTLFPTGSIIVREKLETATSAAPQSVIAMVKREPGFSKATNDWEFFAFDAVDLRLKSRQTKGDCATCHAQAEKTDWVFRDYLK